MADSIFINDKIKDLLKSKNIDTINLGVKLLVAKNQEIDNKELKEKAVHAVKLLDSILRRLKLVDKLLIHYKV